MPKTQLWLHKDDTNKHVYKIRCVHELVVEQEIKASSRDEAFDLFIKHGGLNYSKLDRFITEERMDTIETSYVDASTPESRIEYVGTIVPSREDEDDLELVNETGGYNG